MGDKSADLLELMRDILLTARLDDKARFTQMVAETKAGLEAGECPGQRVSRLGCLPGCWAAEHEACLTLCHVALRLRDAGACFDVLAC